MKIRTFLLGFFFTMLGLVATDFAISVKLEIIENKIEKTEIERNTLFGLTDELRMSSEFLTRFARRYVVVNDENILNNYNAIVSIRDGKIALPNNYNNMFWDLVAAGFIEPPDTKETRSPSLIDRFVQAGVTPLELEKIYDAKSSSDKLAILERSAMRISRGEFGDESYTVIIKDPDKKLATKLLNDSEYLEAKARVVKPISDVITMITQRKNNDIQLLQKKSSELVHLNGITALISVIMLILSAGYIFYHVGLRSVKLLNVVKKIAARDFTAQANISGNDEIAELAIAVNSMGNDLGRAFNNLNDQIILAEKSAQDLEEERQKTQQLLYNVLPSIIVNRLQKGERNIAENFQEVTVMFADIVDFTKLSSKLGPHQTVIMLNDIFGLLDSLIEKYNIEKIKTIGSCYMVAAGVPTKNPVHCQEIAQFAIDVISSIEDYSANFPYDVRVRIGLHTGTIAAGIIGKSQFSYDLWGEVVSLAKMLEGSGVPNKIHISESVKIRLSDDFIFDDNGFVELKDFGSVHSWFLMGSKPRRD